jgi:transposase InsO family protein
VAFAKLDTERTPITAADLLHDRVLPFFAEHEIPLSRVLTDRGSEYCGIPDRHQYELYLALEDMERTRTRTKRPQTNGICERVHRTLLNEFDRVTFRKRFYDQLAPLPAARDAFLDEDNRERPHQGRWCYGKTPMQTSQDTLALAKQKLIA